jgi:hypothetical protein
LYDSEKPSTSTVQLQRDATALLETSSSHSDSTLHPQPTDDDLAQTMEIFSQSSAEIDVGEGEGIRTSVPDEYQVIEGLNLEQVEGEGEEILPSPTPILARHEDFGTIFSWQEELDSDSDGSSDFQELASPSEIQHYIPPLELDDIFPLHVLYGEQEKERTFERTSPLEEFPYLSPWTLTSGATCGG